MAPRRGGGGGGSSGGGSSGISVSCPNPFQDYDYAYYPSQIVYFVAYCLFFVLTLVVIIGLCCVRKRHGNAKKLVGPIYLLSLLCTLTGYALVIIATMLRECYTTPYYSYYSWAIAFYIFWRLGTYLLLVVVVWNVNHLLRERLGSGQAIYKIIPLVILPFMGALTCAYVGLQSYNYWAISPAASGDSDVKGAEQDKLAVAYWVFYLLSVVAAGALSIVTLVSMRSKSLPVGGLLGWVIALIFCMFFWALLMLVEHASLVEGSRGLDNEAYQALEYLIYFFQTFSYIAILFLAKSRAWNNTAVANPVPNMYPNTAYPPQPVQYGQVPPPQQQYAYNGQPGQQYYNQAQPVYNGTPSPMNGNGHMGQVK